MKRFIFLILIIIITLSAAACSNPDIVRGEDKNTPDNPDTEQVVHTPESELPQTQPEDKGVEELWSIDWASQWAMATSHGFMALDYIVHINGNFVERFPFSDKELETAVWIINELHTMGYIQGEVSMQTFHRTDVEQWLNNPWEDLMWGMFEIDGLLRMYSQNVIFTVPGQSEQTIIVGAHYDGMKWPGGNDNASGTALLLESAYNMRTQDNYYTIEYVFFGAEELGYLGSRYYYDSLSEQQRDNIVMMVNADALLSGDFLMYGAGHLYTDTVIENHISQQIYEISRNLNNVYDIDITLHVDALEIGSDHRVFLENNHTVIYLLSVLLIPELGEHIYLGSYNDSYITWRSWHSPEDCIHYISKAWPGMAETNMWSLSFFLETILLTVLE